MNATSRKLSPGMRALIERTKAKYTPLKPRADFVKTAELENTKALVYAIGCIQAISENQREYLSMYRMCAVVRALDDYHIAHLLFTVESHMGREIYLWDDEDEDVEIERGCFVRQLVYDMKQIVELELDEAG